jgi:hypothetical protein
MLFHAVRVLIVPLDEIMFIHAHVGIVVLIVDTPLSSTLVDGILYREGLLLTACVRMSDET